MMTRLRDGDNQENRNAFRDELMLIPNTPDSICKSAKTNCHSARFSSLSDSQHVSQQKKTSFIADVFGLVRSQRALSLHCGEENSLGSQGAAPLCTSPPHFPAAPTYLSIYLSLFLSIYLSYLAKIFTPLNFSTFCSETETDFIGMNTS